MTDDEQKDVTIGVPAADAGDADSGTADPEPEDDDGE